MLDITEVGEATGLASSALRFYERNGLIESVGRAGGKRVYDDGVIELLALIDIYQQAGFTVAEIATLLAASGPDEWRTMATAKLVELEEKIAVASQAKALLEHTLACPNPMLEGCAKFRRSVAAHADHIRSRATERSRRTQRERVAVRPSDPGETRRRRSSPG